MPSLGGPCQRSGGVGDWSGPKKRRGSSDIPLVKLVRRDLAPSQIVTPGVPQGNRSIPQLPVVSNRLSRIEPDHCRLPSWMFCFGISFSVLCPCWANVISFLCRYFIRHSKGMSSEAQQLETAAHNDGNGTPLHLIGTGFRNRQPNISPPHHHCRRRGEEVRVTLWTRL